LEFLKFLTDPYKTLLVCLIVLLICKFIFKIKYMNCFDIIKKHINVFRNSDGKLLIVPFFTYNAIPIIIAFSVNRISIINDNIINSITIILSILTAMLFTILVMVIDLKNKVENNSDIMNSKLNAMKVLIRETYYTVMFEILICVTMLILSFIYLFTNSINKSVSFIMYSLVFLLIFNLFIVLKRIFKIIEEQLK